MASAMKKKGEGATACGDPRFPLRRALLLMAR
jgi:hypothetical protein